MRRAGPSWPGSISLRLALWFALASMLVLGAIGVFLYQSLEREIAWRDDSALAGRIERIRALLDDSSIEALRNRPQLYANMLGSRDSLLWLIDARGQALIEVNPAHLPLPQLTPSHTVRLTDASAGQPTRLAWVDLVQGGRPLRLVAGKMLAEREQMLANYRFKLLLGLGLGALLAFALGLSISRRGLRPVRELAMRAAAIDVQQLHVRLAGQAGDLPVSHELHDLALALDQMLGRLADGYAQLSRFSEDLAHELRTPLSNLMGLTQQALRKERDACAYQDLLASNQEEYERLARMIESMLFLARSAHRSTVLQREPIELAVLAAQLAAYFEGMADERGMAFALQASGTLLADRQLLRRAMANLLANALRYGAAGSTVTIGAQVRSGAVELTVHNVGPAIGAQHIPHLFERFYRCDPARGNRGDSGGLGLAIVRSVMQLHGGTASVRSDDDGTRFTLTFPQ